jgi:hypothetical protein
VERLQWELTKNTWSKVHAKGARVRWKEQAAAETVSEIGTVAKEEIEVSSHIRIQGEICAVTRRLLLTIRLLRRISGMRWDGLRWYLLIRLRLTSLLRVSGLLRLLLLLLRTFVSIVV